MTLGRLAQPTLAPTMRACGPGRSSPCSRLARAAWRTITTSDAMRLAVVGDLEPTEDQLVRLGSLGLNVERCPRGTDGERAER